MANKTVYPYGQGGQLPSGYPIADDLNTNSTQQALSAKQGTIIKPYIMGGYVENDLSEYTVYDGSLGSVSTWYMVGKHILMSVTPGETMKLKPTVTSGTSTGSFYGWLTSSHSEPVSSSTTIKYLSGTTRNWVNNLVEKEVTVPDGAAYICLCYKIGDGEMIWNAWTVAEKSLLVGRSEIVNNVYAGGTDVPLSAEQGKFIASRLYTPIPSGVTRHNIEGGLYNFAKVQHRIGTNVVASVTSQNFQGGACYGDYLFMFTENNTTCWVYNLSTNTLVQTITIPSEERGFVSDCHCNTVNFGTEKYNEGDDFPLVYVSTGYNDGTNSGVLVYRIVNSNNTYSLTLVQTVKFPKKSWTEFVVGDDGNCFVCYTNTRTIYRMKMPKLSDGDITLDMEEALEVYQFTPQEFESANQNRFYYQGKMYVISGASGYGLLIVLDLLKRTREAIVDLNSIGIIGEPEANFIWDGKLCVACRSDASIHALYFD